jgi:hypothetical protein
MALSHTRNATAHPEQLVLRAYVGRAVSAKSLLAAIRTRDPPIGRDRCAPPSACAVDLRKDAQGRLARRDQAPLTGQLKLR